MTHYAQLRFLILKNSVNKSEEESAVPPESADSTAHQ